MRNTILAALILILTASLADAATLEKAKAMRANGLLQDAKRELVEVLFAEGSSDPSKAEALLLLGEIGLDEKKPEVARENWERLVADYPDLPPAQIALAKLEVLDQLGADPGTSTSPDPGVEYPPGTILVVGPERFPWAALQIAGAIGPSAVPVEGSITEGLRIAATEPNVKALVEVGLDVSSAFESGRVVCYRSSGAKSWEQKVMFNLGGGEERIARRFVEKLVGKVRGKACP